MVDKESQARPEGGLLLPSVLWGSQSAEAQIWDDRAGWSTDPFIYKLGGCHGLNVSS